LWRNARLFLAGLAARGFDTMGSVTPVVPILVGDPQRTIEMTARLRQQGVHICPAIPPMVPAHLSRVRAHVTAAHQPADLDAALAAIADVGTALGIARPPAPAAAAASPRRVARGRMALVESA
jgi:glycine C-acetyltransferase